MTSTTAFQYSDWFIYNSFWDADYTAYDMFEIGYGGSPKENYNTLFTQEIRFNNTTEKPKKLNCTAGALSRKRKFSIYYREGHWKS